MSKHMDGPLYSPLIREEVDERIIDVIKQKVNEATPEELEEAIKIIEDAQNQQEVKDK